MALRRPIVNISGALQELSAGDTLYGGAGGAVAFTEVTLDFGAAPTYSTTFSFSDGAAGTSSRVMMTPSASPAIGRVVDELEMDSFMCAAVCLVAGTVTVSVVALPGPVTGQYKFNYILG